MQFVAYWIDGEFSIRENTYLKNLCVLQRATRGEVRRSETKRPSSWRFKR